MSQDVIAGAEDQPAEDRRNERVRTLIGARAIFNNGGNSVDCQIRNLSATGAKITLSAAVGLPESFILDIPSRGKSYHAELRWRHEDAAGVDFVGDEMGKSSLAPEEQIAALKKENAILRRRVSELVARLADLGHSERPE
ncbi:MAG: PilZ domain-containing protein [Beijerinckiaceae bacterium]|jgi:hypothetical protein|nr:PilZ domain-containing protein [Beijerinckiaceae bacterium]MBX9757760.1 PilZ domain-containing protein [Beijerinckiaceae bacterium]MDO9442913.1 PilZ domain-containing protein [Beijerinckiaceae bacterium]